MPTVTTTDTSRVLESVNRQLALNGEPFRLILESAHSSKVALCRLKTDTNREMSEFVTNEEMHEILAVLQRVLQQIGL